MTYLLDTHTFLWILNTPEILPAKIQSIYKDGSAALLISNVRLAATGLRSLRRKADLRLNAVTVFAG
jgi:PIN domain nuclease of toxin-antitoxin system